MARLALLAAFAVQCISQTIAVCSRAGSFEATRSFFAGTIRESNSPDLGGVRLAEDVQITENNESVSGLNKTIFGSMLGLESAYQIEVSDETTCSIAKLFVAKEAPGPSIASLRLKVSETENNTINIHEVEILKATQGSHEIFKPDGFPKNIPLLWRSSNPTALKNGERATLVRIADSYTQALEEGNNTKAIAALDCPRLENGNQTTLHCGANMDLFQWPVTDRRWVVDTMTGVVMGSFFFNYRDGKGKLSQMGTPNRGPDSEVGNWLHEYFRIVDGKIVEVVAAMKILDADYEDVWMED